MQTGLLISIYSFTVTLFTTISNNLSDKYGRKPFLVVGEMCKAVGVLLLALGNDVPVLTFGQFFSGLGFAIVAGTDSAFLYENYASLNKEDEYKKAEAKSHSILFFAVLVAGIIGSVISKYNIKIPFILTVPFNLAAAFIALTFSNIVSQNKNNHKRTAGYILKKMKAEKEVNYYILLYAVIRSIIMTVFIGLIPFYFFDTLKIDISLFGVLFATYMITGYVAGKYENKIEECIGKNGYSILMCSLLAIVLLSLGVIKSIFGVILPVLLYFVAGSIRPFAIGNINHLLREKSIRGTVLSFAELICGILNAIFILVSFYVYDYYSLAHTFYFLFYIYLLLCAGLFICKMYIMRMQV